MSKLEDRENRRRSSVISSMVQSAPPVVNKKRGRPKEERETKKRVSLSILPSLYRDIQKIAYMQRKSTSELVEEMMEDYRRLHKENLIEYELLQSEHMEQN